MTQELWKDLYVEAYQPRHLTPYGQEIAPVLSFDDFVASLWKEARKPVPGATYAPTPANEEVVIPEMERFIADRDAKLGAIGSKMPRRIKRTPPLSRAGQVEVALAQGQSLRDALQQHLTKGGNT
jgi:hypothetical protein